MNLDAVRQLRTTLTSTDWLNRAREFAAAVRTAGHQPGQLLVVGTPDYEPWHFVAHLDDAARSSGYGELAPTLIRQHVPAGAPPHLAIDLRRLQTASRGETVLVVAPTATSDGLLSRLEDARLGGATIFALDHGDPDLQTIVHETLTVSAASLDGSPLEFDAAEHLVTLAAANQLDTVGGWRAKLVRVTRLGAEL
jgi:hypothetical protein